MDNNPILSDGQETSLLGYLMPTNTGIVVLAPPPLPRGFEPLSDIQPSTTTRGWWSCLAYQQRIGVYGLLIYWHSKEHGFFFYEEENATDLFLHYGSPFGFASASSPHQEQGASARPVSWWSIHHVRQILVAFMQRRCRHAME